MGHFGLTQINWHVKHVYCGLHGLTRLWHVSYRVAFGSTRLWPKPEKTCIGFVSCSRVGSNIDTPRCSASLRGGGILPTPFILLSERWWWLPTTSTAWLALASKGPSSVWTVCRASNWVSRCWGGSTPLRPSSILTWCQITCFSHKGLQRSVSVWLGFSFFTCWGLTSLPMVGKRCL